MVSPLGIFYSLVLENGSIPAFEEALEREGLAGEFAYFDQGYTYAASAVETMRENAKALLVISLLIWLVVLLFFVFFYVLRTQKDSAILRTLGASKTQAFAYSMLGIAIIVLVSGCAGGIIGLMVYEQAANAAFETALQQNQANMAFSDLVLHDTGEWFTIIKAFDVVVSAAILQCLGVLCVAGAEMAADLQRGPDGLARIEMSVKNPYNIGGSGHTQTALAVIGEYDGEGDTLYCPYNTVTALGQEMDGAYEYASRLTFAIGDNRQLPQFKDAAAVFSDAGRESNYTLRIHDSNFYEAVSAVEKNGRLLQLFQPVLFCLCAVIGFMASLLSMRGRKKEIVILRCLGVGSAAVFHMAMLEQLILSVFGVAVGIGLYGLVGKTWHLYPAEMLIGLLCYWTGTIAALAKIVRGDILAMLKVEE